MSSSDRFIFRHLLRISRPRFWLYLFGPFLLGIAAGYRQYAYSRIETYGLELLSFSERIKSFFALTRALSQLPSLMWAWVQQDPKLALFVISLFLLFFLIVGGLFLFPANLLLYGINDYFDRDTDRLNPKKQGYEHRLSDRQAPTLLRWVMMITLLWSLGFLMFITQLPLFDTLQFAQITLPYILFLLLAVGYSAPPLRLKARPWWDSLSNILYALPALVGYYLAIPFFQPWGTRPSDILLPFLAASLWCMAMHAYSAVPDIKADLGANLSTIATRLGARQTLWLCLGLYTGSTILAVLTTSSQALRLVFVTLGIAYIGLMLASLRRADQIFPLYRYFPLVNTFSGMILFFSLFLF